MIGRALLAAATGALTVGALMAGTAAAAEPVRLHAAGSLRAALNEVVAAYEASRGAAAGREVATVYGPSGLLKDRIAAGEASDLFASANMTHPQALAAAVKGGPVVLFARNRLCALARPGLGVTAANLLERMLDPALRLAISTPKADPSGDYAWALFARAEALEAGSRGALETKALQLVGGPNSPAPPPDRTLYGLILERGEADLFLTYCTNALHAAREVKGLEVVRIPDALAVGADYGLIALGDAGARLALFILSPPAQAILARQGFAAPGLPAGS